MYEIDGKEMTRSFFPLWSSAGKHLNAYMDGGLRSWLRAHPNPPFLEHLSFRLGNQLFFIRVVDADGAVEGPGTTGGLFHIADSSRGHACLMPMRRSPRADEWLPAHPGWGLLDARSRMPIDPPALITDEPIEMTEWEMHGMAVQVVRDFLSDEGFQLMSWQENPNVDPAIWLIGESKGPEWVVVRSTKYPARKAERPGNWNEIAANCAKLGRIGHFASVALASARQPFNSEREAPVPLLRGHGMHVNFEGLE